MKYSQTKAMWAVTVASLRSMLRSPSTVVFSIAFPFIFILVFGFIGNNMGQRSFLVQLEQGSDTVNPIYQTMRQSGAFKFTGAIGAELEKKIKEGALAGTIGIFKDQKGEAPYIVNLHSTTASADKWPQLKLAIESVVNNISNNLYTDRPTIALFQFDAARDIKTIREYKTIDFILPGQLGFSLLSAGVFGVAFMFFNLRNTQVLKRFFATPISRTHIVLGEALSRVLFQMVTAVVILVVGHFFFGFTLINGIRTVVEILVLSFIGLLVFMGFGFIVSGVAKNESSIPPMANVFTMPQFLLAGTFFSIDVFPKWLQPISRALPLTYLNDAMRSVAFEGMNLWDVRTDILVLILWGIAAYFVAVKVFRWE